MGRVPVQDDVIAVADRALGREILREDADLLAPWQPTRYCVETPMYDASVMTPVIAFSPSVGVPARLICIFSGRTPTHTSSRF